LVALPGICPAAGVLVWLVADFFGLAAISDIPLRFRAIAQRFGFSGYRRSKDTNRPRRRATNGCV